MENTIEKLKEELKSAKVIERLSKMWNEEKLEFFQKLHDKSYKEHFRNLKNQDKTKEISPILYSIFSNICQEENIRLDENNTTGSDYLYDSTIPIEAKITLSNGNTWTGNGTKKTPWHILFRINLNEDGVIIGIFCMIANIEECLTQWSKPKDSTGGGRVNFSEIKFSNNCLDNLFIINGKVKKSQKWLKYEY